jgi:hypothetical protein
MNVFMSYACVQHGRISAWKLFSPRNKEETGVRKTCMDVDVDR